MKCSKCGYDNNEEAKFCNKCGTKLISEKVKEVKSANKTLKMLLIVVSVLIVITISGMSAFLYVHDVYGVGMTDKEKQNKILQIISTKNYDKARERTYNYFDGTDTQDMAYKNYLITLIDLCETTGTTNIEGAVESYKELEESINN